MDDGRIRRVKELKESSCRIFACLRQNYARRKINKLRKAVYNAKLGNNVT